MHIYTHTTCAQHEVAPGHPERPDRLIHLLTHLENSGILQEHPLRQADTAEREDVLRAHPEQHLAFVESMSPSGSDIVPLDPDTWMGSHSLQAALHAAGAVCDAVDAIGAGDALRAFCAVRPPGHHAERSAAMGFCLFNSIAIGALKALDKGIAERVAILDFDVHHGNGTVDIFKDDPRALVCSSFQHPYYPNRLYDVERPNIVNTPLPAGSGGTEFRNAIDQDWWSAVEAHQPQLIFVSAGFDAHQADPLANLNLVEADFAWVTQQIVSRANELCGGRIISALEGGYDLQALCSSAEAHVLELLN